MTPVVKLILVAGARPNFMKLAPVYFELRKHPELFEPLVVHAGQHYDQQMSEVFFNEFGLPPPNFMLEGGPGSHAEQTGRVMIGLERILLAEQPRMVIVFGDVNSTLAAALTAAKLQIPIAHVEAGLRSCDRSMPEEINRILTDVLSDLLFTTSDDANLNLIREGICLEKIFLVGNVMIDTLRHFLPLAEKSAVLGVHGLVKKEYVLVTLHRPANVDAKENLAKIAQIISAAAEKRTVVFPLHPRTRRNFEKEFRSGWKRLCGNVNIKLLEPLGYLEFLKLQRHAAVVLTDSGGIQEETTYLGVPCLTLRKNTERPVTIKEGTNRLVGLDMEKITSWLDFYLEGGCPNRKRPFLWDGQAAGRIVRLLAEHFELPPVQAHAAVEHPKDERVLVH